MDLGRRPLQPHGSKDPPLHELGAFCLDVAPLPHPGVVRYGASKRLKTGSGVGVGVLQSTVRYGFLVRACRPGSGMGRCGEGVCGSLAGTLVNNNRHPHPPGVA